MATRKKLNGPQRRVATADAVEKNEMYAAFVRFIESAVPSAQRRRYLEEMSPEESAPLEEWFWSSEGQGLIKLCVYLEMARVDEHVVGSDAASGLVALMSRLIRSCDIGKTGVNAILQPLAKHHEKEGVSKLFKERAAKTHGRNREASARIPELWARSKAQGKNKTQAANEIAAEVHLSVATVRDKLKGL